VDKLKSEGSDGRVHVLVLMCGLNDFKVPRSTPGVFGADLEALLREIRDITGPTTLFILPGLPLEATLAFPTPLHHLACAVGSLWDEQKRALASAAGRVVFVPPPPLSTVGGAVRSLLSEDLVHPNAAGYTLWGQHLAQAAWSSRH
jgi:lysophospholipase L1-like esterase